MSTPPAGARETALVVDVRISLVVVVGLLGSFGFGAMWVNSVSSTANATNVLVMANNDKVSANKTAIEGRLDAVNADLGSRIVRLERDAVARFEGDEKRADENAKATGALDIRLTRVEAQKEYYNATGVVEQQGAQRVRR